MHQTLTVFESLVEFQIFLIDKFVSFRSDSKSFEGDPLEPSDELDNGEKVSEAEEYPTDEPRPESI